MVIKSEEKRLVKNTIIFAIGSLGTKIIQFAMLPLYTNYMTNSEYGISNLIFTVVQLLLPILSISIYDAVLRFGMIEGENPACVLKASFIIIFIDLIMLIALAPIIRVYQPLEAWTGYLIVYLFFNIVNCVGLNYLKVKDRNKIYALISILQAFILAVLNIILIGKFKTGIKGYMLSNIISIMVACVLSLIFSGAIHDVRRAPLDLNLLQKMIKYSTPLIFNAVSWWLISSSDKIMIELMCGSALLGVYSVAAKIPALINVFISIFQQSWGLSAIKEMEKKQNNLFYSKIFEIYSFIVFAASIFAVLVIRPFMKFYIGGNFQTSVQYVPLLIFSASFSAISTFAGSLYTAMKDTKSIMNTTILAGLTNILINYFAIKSLGVMGAVIGTVWSYLLIANIRLFDLSKRISFKFARKRYFLNTIIGLVTCVIVTLGYNSIALDFIILLMFAINNRSLFLAHKKGEINE